MSNPDFSKTYEEKHDWRFKKTYAFLQQFVDPDERILDLGPTNPMSEFMKAKGYQVENTPDKLDLDLDFETVTDKPYDVVTAFEIFEHLVSPFPILKSLKASKLVASVPLRLWFAKAYWNVNDPFDRHYHEFEDRQFDMLLNKAGWKVVSREKWKGKTGKIGIRPLLRKYTDRYYIVYCERG